jgi:TPR repeat protein
VAQGNLGSCYKSGQGAEQNFDRAAELYFQSLNNG